MRELCPTSLCGSDEARVNEHRQGLCRFAFVEPRHARREQGPEFDAEHAGCMGVPQIRAGPRYARKQQRSRVPTLVEVGHAPPVAQVAGDLSQEQRIAAAGGPRAPDRLLGQLASHLLGQEGGRRGRAKRHELLQLGLTLLRNAPPKVRQSFTVGNGTIEGCGIVDGKVRTAVKSFTWSFSSCGRWAERWAVKVRATRATPRAHRGRPRPRSSGCRAECRRRRPSGPR